MKKLYSIVLMATALLVSTNTWAKDFNGTTRAELQAAITAIINGTETDPVIKLQQNVGLNGPIWVGTPTLAGNYGSITLDLNGHSIYVMDNNPAKTGTTVYYMFAINHGELLVRNSNESQEAQIIMNPAEGSDPNSDVFVVTGAETSNYAAANSKNTEDEDGGYISHLDIGTGVKVSIGRGCLGSAIIVDALYSTNYTDAHYSPAKTAARWATYDRYDPANDADVITYATNGYTKAGAVGTKSTTKDGDKYGFAYGVRVDVRGKIEVGGIAASGKDAYKAYGIKANGLLLSPNPAAAVKDAPFVHIHAGAEIKVNDDSQNAAAIYASGYAKWLIEGSCTGNIGIYAASGKVQVTGDAAISSTAPNHTLPTGSNGVSGSGSAIVINSRDQNSGHVDFQFSGDPEVTATSGYAIEETVTSASTTKVENVTITGGTFSGGTDPNTHEQQPAIVVSNTSTEADVPMIVYGGSLEGSFVVEGNTSVNVLDEHLAADVHTTTVIIDGNPVTVISEGAAPASESTWADAVTYINNWSSATSRPSIKIEGAFDQTLPASWDLAELELNHATNVQVLTIPEDMTLKVGRVVLGEKAQIIVNPGAKLIITGAQGFIAPSINNILLKHNSNTGKYATFLFHPNVTSNRHPNAKVEFTTNSWRESSSALQWEWFGIPTYNKAKSITSTGQAYVAVYENGGWTNLGFIGGTDDDNPAVLAKLDKPFAAYDLLAIRAHDAAAPEITISGELVGNMNAPLNANLRWSPFANSYTAEVDAELLVNALSSSANIRDAIYVAEQNTNGTINWNVKAGDLVKNLKLQPMQAFMLNNPNYVEETSINYASMVYAPAVPGYAPAPARRAAAKQYTAAITINVANEEGTWDDVDLRESEDAKSYEKFLNSDVNIYVADGEKNDYIVAEDLEGTYVGFSTVNGGNFTVNFANVEGRDLMLLDHETGAEVLMVEGNTYEFAAAANSANDYRFEIVNPRKVTTAIENAEAVKSAKGIYTITGQYMGEMNVWNTLPAGVYVVNGEKRVK